MTGPANSNGACDLRGLCPCRRTGCPIDAPGGAGWRMVAMSDVPPRPFRWACYGKPSRMNKAQLRAQVAQLQAHVKQLFKVLDTKHLQVREVASRWSDGPTGAVRAELHVIANELLAPTLGDLT